MRKVLRVRKYGKVGSGGEGIRSDDNNLTQHQQDFIFIGLGCTCNILKPKRDYVVFVHRHTSFCEYLKKVRAATVLSLTVCKGVGVCLRLNDRLRYPVENSEV